MNRDDIIRMAQEAWVDNDHLDACGYTDLYEFAALVAAAEREACAKLCEEQIDEWVDDRPRYAVSECAVAIRARGEK